MNSRTATAILILGSFLATVSATDIYLPSLPGMAVYFGRSAESLQTTISIYLFAQVCSAPLWGAISDYYDRKKALLVGMIIFIAGCTLCALANSVYMLIFARFVQGIGGIAPYVIGWATISEIYSKEEGAKIMSLLGGVMTIVPLVAPIVGGQIDVLFGWRANFFLIVIIALLSLLLIGRSKFAHQHQNKADRFYFRRSLKEYKTVLDNRSFLFYVLVFAFLCVGEFAYLTTAPFYLESILKLSAPKIGLFISLTAVAYVVGSFATPKIISRFGNDFVFRTGVILTAASGIILLLNYFFLTPSIILFGSAAALYLLGLALIWGPSTANAFEQVPVHQRGKASATRSLVNTLALTCGAVLGSMLPGLTLWPLALIFLAASLCAMMSFKLAQAAVKI